jgi:broad specificity phosphatase PhoE
MTRALKTADFIAKEIGVDCEVWPDIYEIEGCHKCKTPYSGKTKTEISTLFPNTKLPPECTEEGWFLQDQIETHDEAWERAGRVVQKLHEMARDDSNKGKTVAVVTHGLFLDYLLGRLVGRQMRGSPSFGFSNTSVTMVVLNGNDCKINYVNAVPHLYRSEYSSSSMNV